MFDLFSSLFNNGPRVGLGFAAPSKRTRHRGHAYREVPFKLINHFMAQNGGVMTRQVSRQLQRYRWKAHVTARNRRGQRCSYERAAA